MIGLYQSQSNDAHVPWILGVHIWVNVQRRQLKYVADQKFHKFDQVYSSAPGHVNICLKLD